jgi:cytochrome P450
MNGSPLSPMQKRAHATLLIQAGADTTGTGLGSTLRFIAMDPKRKEKAAEEIRVADQAGHLSTPIKYEECREHLPFFSACIRESLRLNPPATNLFARVVGKDGKTIDGHFIPSGTEITSNAFVVQRDPELYAPDPDAFRPERWLEDKEKSSRMEAANFVFGIGSRICLGKDVALMELYKLLPEVRNTLQGHLRYYCFILNNNLYRYSVASTWRL